MVAVTLEELLELALLLDELELLEELVPDDPAVVEPLVPDVVVPRELVALVPLPVVLELPEDPLLWLIWLARPRYRPACPRASD